MKVLKIEIWEDKRNVLIYNPSPFPPATPISASLASPGPLTAHPITAIVIFLSISFNRNLGR